MRNSRSALACAIFSRSAALSVVRSNPFTASWEDSQIADSNLVRVLGAPREPGDVQFYAVWHPRVDEDPAHSWLRQVLPSVLDRTKVIAVGTKIVGYLVLKSEGGEW
jgi:DNA-binding transcriptional LysR family regulator